LEDFARNYKPVVVFFPEDRKKHEVATDIAELILASVGEDLPAEIVAAYGRVVEAEGFLAEKAFSADPKTQTNNIPGMLEYRAREHPKDVKCIFETNFRNDKYRYLSCVYKVSNNEGITEVTNLFCDPVFRVFKAVLGTPTILADAQAYEEILISYRYWRSKVKMWPRNIRDSEKDLMTAMDKLMEAFFGDSWEDLVTRYTPPSEKIILMVLVGNALQTAKAKLGFKPVDAYKKQIKKITGVEYRTRSAVNTNIPLFPNEITIDTVKENDVLVFFMEDSSCAYPSVDFITEGVSGIAAAGSLISADRLTPGIIEAYNNTVTAITYVKSSLDEGIKPRWYGIATPPGANSWTSSKLINTILPEEASKGIDAFFGMLDDTEELLDSWGENISDAKKKLEAVMENIDRYFRLVQKIIDKVKALIESLSLTQLPTVYTAIWKGSSTDIPGILSTALNEKQWLNSTYGGIIIFMTGSALGIAAKSYVAYNDNTRKFESFQEQMATLAGNGPTWGDISQRAKETREELEGLEKDIKIDFKEVVGGLFSNTVHFGSIESVNDISDITSFLIEASEKNYNRVSSRTDSAVVENTYIYHKKSGE